MKLYRSLCAYFLLSLSAVTLLSGCGRDEKKPVSKLTNVETSKFKAGYEYKYYGNNPCTNEAESICVDKSDAELLCKALSGDYTQRMLKWVYQAGGDKDETLFTAGNIGRLQSNWTGDKCSGGISATGLYIGSSAKVSYSGNIISFVIAPDGKVLAHWLNGMIDIN